MCDSEQNSYLESLSQAHNVPWCSSIRQVFGLAHPQSPTFPDHIRPVAILWRELTFGHTAAGL